MDSFKWCEVVNRWFAGGYVTEDEIVQLSTMNLFDLCEQFRSAVRECVITFCQQHATEWCDGYDMFGDNRYIFKFKRIA